MKEDSNLMAKLSDGRALGRRGFVKSMGLLAGTAVLLKYATPSALAFNGPNSGMLTDKNGKSSIVEETGKFDCQHKMVSFFIAKPAQGSRFPAIFLVHEVFGLTENVRNHARELAAKGNLVFVPDCLPASNAETADYAVSGPNEMEKLNAGIAFLMGRSDVDASRVKGVARCWDKSRDASRKDYSLASSTVRVNFDVEYYRCEFPFNRMGSLT